MYDGADVENLPSEIPAQQRERLAQVFRLFDRNGNGIIDSDERDILLRFLRGFQQ